MGYLRAVLVTVQCRHAPIFRPAPIRVTATWSCRNSHVKFCCRLYISAQRYVAEMHVDLFTLYLIIIGTLLASACLTYWEHRTHPGRSTSLRLLAAGFATLAAGCSIALYRAALPGVLGSALSNLVILGGYLLVLNAVAALNGRLYRAGSLGLLGVMALIWAGAGYSGQNLVWTYVSAFPIALVSGLTAWGAVALSGAETAAAVAHRGGRDRPARAALPGPQLHPALVGGQGWPGRADAGQQYHHVRRRAVFHRAAHDAAQAGARRDAWPAAANRRPTT